MIKLKVGKEVLDPYNRVVTITEIKEDGMVVVRLYGPYGAHIHYSASCLRPVEEEKE